MDRPSKFSCKVGNKVLSFKFLEFLPEEVFHTEGIKGE